MITSHNIPRKKWWVGDTPTHEEMAQHLLEIAMEPVEDEEDSE